MIRSKTMLASWPLLLLACGGGQKTGPGNVVPAPVDQANNGGVLENMPLPQIPSTPSPEPASLFVTGAIGNLNGELPKFAAYADAIQPGVGAMVAPGQVMMAIGGMLGTGLDGIDSNKPMYVVMLDPEVAGKPLFAFAVADEAKAKSSLGSTKAVFANGYVAIGEHAALVAAAPYVLSSLVKSTPAPYVTGTVYVSKILAKHGNKIKAESSDPMEKKMQEAMINVMRGVDRVDGSLQASATDVTAQMNVTALAESSLAKFAATQTPADHVATSQLGKDWALVAGAKMDMSLLMPFFVEFAQMSGQNSADVSKFWQLAGRDFAGAFNYDEPGKGNAKQKLALRFGMLWGLSDGKAVAGLLETASKMFLDNPAMKELTAKGKVNFAFKKDAVKVKGGALSEISVKPNGTENADNFAALFGDALIAHFGVVGNWMVLSHGKTGKTQAQAIAKNVGAQKKQSMGANVDAAIAESIAAKESGLLAMDLPTIGGTFFAMRSTGGDKDKEVAAKFLKLVREKTRSLVRIGLGFDGGKMSLRLVVPAEQIRGTKDLEEQLRN